MSDNLKFEIEFGKIFEKNYKKTIDKNPLLQKKIWKTIDLLAENPKHPSLNSHIIKETKFGQVWSSWVHRDLRIFWNYLDDKIIILLLDIGSHDEVY